MKNKYILLLSIVFFISCSKIDEACNESDPKAISFSFILTDENGKDLFFTPESEYDPNNAVVLEVIQDSSLILQNTDWFSFGIPIDSSYFNLEGFYLGIQPSEYAFLIEFLPDDADTITIATSSVQNDEDCLLNYDAFFNGELICQNCSYYEIYKITKQ
jgi:hypothetical protein